MGNFFNYIRNKFRPKTMKVFNVELVIFDNHNERAIGRFFVDVDAPNAAKAKTRALEVMNLRVGRYKDITHVKKPLS